MTSLEFLLIAIALVALGCVTYQIGYRHGEGDAISRVEAWGRTQQRTPR